MRIVYVHMISKNTPSICMPLFDKCNFIESLNQVNTTAKDYKSGFCIARRTQLFRGNSKKCYMVFYTKKCLRFWWTNPSTKLSPMWRTGGNPRLFFCMVICVSFISISSLLLKKNVRFSFHLSFHHPFVQPSMYMIIHHNLLAF